MLHRSNRTVKEKPASACCLLSRRRRPGGAFPSPRRRFAGA